MIEVNLIEPTNEIFLISNKKNIPVLVYKISPTLGDDYVKWDVLYMDKRFEGRTWANKKRSCSVNSYSYPDISDYPRAIYLRGSARYDDNKTTTLKTTNPQKTIEDIKATFTEWGENCSDVQ